MQKIKQYIQKWLGITDIKEEQSIGGGILNYALMLSIENQHKIHELMYPNLVVKEKKESKQVKAKKIISKSKKK